MSRIEKNRVFLDETRGKKDRFAHQLKVANRSCSMAEGSPARDGAQRSEREKGGDHAPGDSKGHSPWRAFGDFPRDGKVTRGLGRSAHTKGSAEGASPPRPSVGWNPTDPAPSGHSPDPETPACCKASSPADSLGKPPGGTAWPAGRPQTATQKSGGRSPCRVSRG